MREKQASEGDNGQIAWRDQGGDDGGFPDSVNGRWLGISVRRVSGARRKVGSDSMSRSGWRGEDI